MKPRYLDKVGQAVKENLLVINGNRLLIELLEEEEVKTASGIITNVVEKKTYEAAERARVAVVLAVGPGYSTDEDGDVDMPYKTGDYILVNHLGVVKFGEFLDMRNYKPYTVGLVTDDLVQGRVGNLEALTNLFKQP